LETVVIYVNGDIPDSFNYCFATTVYEWNVIGQTGDGLTAVNPYSHADLPWVAADWAIYPVPAGMDISVKLREDVKWQDGNPVNASDVEWCLEFLRDRNVSRYAETMGTLIDVEVISEYNCTIHSSEEGLGLFYDYMGLGILLPRHIWDRAWASDAAVLNWNPQLEAYNVAPGYTVGPNATLVPTCVMGTGPYIFQYYDTGAMSDDMWRNENYFMTQKAVAALMDDMFWEVGDADGTQIVDVDDMTAVSIAFGARPTDPLPNRWNPQANFDGNSLIDMRDLRTASYHQTWQQHWP